MRKKIMRRRFVLIASKNDLIYLKLGIGVPCAGQVKAILAPRVLVIVCESTLLTNFGLVDPIGSNKI